MNWFFWYIFPFYGINRLSYVLKQITQILQFNLKKISYWFAVEKTIKLVL